MTEVTFYFNVPGKIGYACRLLRKALREGGPVGVVADGDTLRALDAELWSFSQLDFIPHCSSDATPELLAASPIVLASECAHLQHSKVLLQLGPSVPTGFERFERLLELVQGDVPDRRAARERWRYYADRGYVIQSHDVAGG